jgi:hypothetical protein
MNHIIAWNRRGTREPAPNSDREDQSRRRLSQAVQGQHGRGDCSRAMCRPVIAAPLRSRQFTGRADPSGDSAGLTRHGGRIAESAAPCKFAYSTSAQDDKAQEHIYIRAETTGSEALRESLSQIFLNRFHPSFEVEKEEEQVRFTLTREQKESCNPPRRSDHHRTDQHTSKQEETCATNGDIYGTPTHHRGGLPLRTPGVSNIHPRRLNIAHHNSLTEQRLNASLCAYIYSSDEVLMNAPHVQDKCSE